jgi:serine protease AprX
MKIYRLSMLLCLCTLAAFSASAQSGPQTRYIIKLKDKGNSPYTLANPSAYLSARSLARRTRYGIVLDSTDLPVTPSYLESIENVPNVTVLNASRWMNQVSVQISDTASVPAALAAINSFSFVQSSAPTAARIMGPVREENKKLEEDFTPSTARTAEVQDNYFNYGQSAPQVNIHNGAFLHNMGLRGQSMIIGMLDAGFTNYRTVSGFDSVRTNGQILDTWDFVLRNADVNNYSGHGTACFSAMAANIPGQLVGTAPKANFFLYKSEDAATEYPIEEHNWVCGAERVDSAGGDVISSSLGYNQFDDPYYNHTYADLNGNTTISAKGADLAAKKGVLVLQAAGNSGNGGWKYILTPADADSVLAVGAVNKDSVVGYFSSYGPSSDGQVKPDVASVGEGTILQSSAGNIGGANGTSFACPNMAGLATCLWQGFQELNNMKIVVALRQSGHKATAPDDRVGYGIPDMKKAVMLLLKEFATSSSSIFDCKTTLSWTSKDVEAMKYEIERKGPGEANYTKVAERLGTGTAFANHTYSISDTLANVQLGTVSYRIRQIIDTAAASFTADYIDTVSVNFVRTCVTTGIDPLDSNDATIRIVPNPAHQAFTLRMMSPAPANNLLIQITNTSGQVVAQLNHSKGAGMAAIPVSIAHLAKGKYFVSVYHKGKLLGTQELLKL